MRGRHRYLMLLGASAALAVIVLAAAALGRRVSVTDARPAGRAPSIRPDYAAITVPPNIAPLNFRVQEPGSRYVVEITSTRGDAIRMVSRRPDVLIPMARWKELLGANPGQELRFEVCVQGGDGEWQRFEPITNMIAREEADPYIVYREMNIVYRRYAMMRICQRSIESYDETVVLDNWGIEGCMNCHTFHQNGADRMLMQVRTDYGSGMLLFDGGKVTKVDTRTRFNSGMATFASWHPNGRVVAYSITKVRQFFHAAADEVREHMDLKSDLALYMVDSGEVTTTGSISRPDRSETWPAWSADGKHLYFSAGPVWWRDGLQDWGEHERARYDLMRIAYDVDSGAWGEPETVLSAEEAGMSITQPRPSPDGRFLVVCGTPHGGMPVLDPEADLYLLDLTDDSFRKLECNSNQTESWHSWSGEGRWLVVSGKRGSGPFTRPFLTYIDEHGRASKPFVLPQKDPTHYDSDIRVYNMCEFVRNLVPVRGERLARIIRDAEWQRVDVAVTGASPATGDRAAPSPDPDSYAEPWSRSRE